MTELQITKCVTAINTLEKLNNKVISDAQVCFPSYYGGRFIFIFLWSI